MQDSILIALTLKTEQKTNYKVDSLFLAFMTLNRIIHILGLATISVQQHEKLKFTFIADFVMSS